MKIIFTILMLIISVTSAYSQFDLEAYKQYLNAHKNMTYTQLLNEFPAGRFRDGYPTPIEKAEFLDSIRQKLSLTDAELSLIQKNGFAVSGNKGYGNYVLGFYDIYQKDLPLYISADAILHAAHYSFNKVLEEYEKRILKNKLDAIIKLLYSMKFHFVQVLKDSAHYSTYKDYDILEKSLKNYDLYICIARRLLSSGTSELSYTENQNQFDEINKKIAALKPDVVNLFADSPRQIDFSVFKPRGHYDDIELSSYFQAFTWLSKAEMFIQAPQRDNPIYSISDRDIKRQLMLVGLLGLAYNDTTYIFFDPKLLINEYTSMSKALNLLSGKSDNMDLIEAGESLTKAGIQTMFDLLDSNKLKTFQNELISKHPEGEMYNSKLIESNLLDPKPVKLDVTFSMFGQKPVLDGFITANTVYDRIVYNNQKVPRMLPNTLDILFALGNDASVQLLENEIEKYKFSTNLAALRYYISSLDTNYWYGSVYGTWLNAITKLNPPLERQKLPGFMQTAAWWQKSMNTQLASWAELRHDFLLYAKQPYSYQALCSYPYSYVEPVPELYKAISKLYKKIYKIILTSDRWTFCKYISGCIPVLDKLAEIAESELKGEMLPIEHINFLQSAFSKKPSCSGTLYNGWYLQLYYPFGEIESYNFKNFNDYIVADVHTAPSDEAGNNVGWVLHAGTGAPRLAIITVPDYEGKLRAYAGPVYNYREVVTTNYLRLTDSEWLSAKSFNPQWSYLYQSNSEGKLYDNPVSLFTYTTGVDIQNENNLDNGFALSCSPNPVVGKTLISFNIPPGLTGAKVKLVVFNFTGQLIKTLVSVDNLPAQNYGLHWDCIDNSGCKVVAGVYIINLQVNEIIKTINIVIGR